MKSKKLKILLFTLFSSLTLTSCDTEEIGDRISTVINEMLPNLWVTLMQLGLFLLVVILFLVFAYKPLKKKLKQRSDYIEKNIKESEEFKQEALENVKKSQEIIAESEKHAGDIIQNAQKTAENKASQFEMELASTLEKQRQQAHKDIEAERRKMIKEAQEEIVDAALTTSKEILQREITKEDNDKFVNDFINELTEGK